jgi:hypothetical protein
MYPTGGYGNFFYYLLSEFFQNTVKVDNSNFKFSNIGNSHSCNKYTEPFCLGTYYFQKKLKEFKYDYTINDTACAKQISAGKKFLVLGDTGNRGDNINFIRKYFPNAKIIRIYANTFKEKLIVWANCMQKAMSGRQSTVYKNSLLTTIGIANFKKKKIDDVDDNDAVSALTDFLKNDFYVFGKNYGNAIKKEGIINLPFSIFLKKNDLLSFLENLAKEFNTKIIKKKKLEETIDLFLSLQKNFNILNSDKNTIIGKALCNLS